ncbi:hypothetical protein D3C71_1236300 [compost metagenome]
MRFHLEEIFRHEVFDLFIAAHHQPKHWRLDAPDGEHALITGVTPQNRVGTCHVDAVQPVGAGSREGRNAQRDKFAVGAQTRNRTLHRLRVEIVNQATLNLLTLFRRQFEVVEHLVHQKLPFPVRVTRVNHFFGIVKKTFDDVELFGDGGTRLQFPLLRHDRQIVEIPARVTAVVDIRLRLFEQVTDTPGDHLSVSAFDKAVALAMRLGQHIGNRTGQARLFRNKQTHRINGSQSSDDRRAR